MVASNSAGVAVSSNATLTVTNPPSAPGVYDLSKSFSTNSNPNGVWRYGYKTTIAGTFSLVSTPGVGGTDNGVTLQAWYNGSTYPAFYYNGSSATGIVHNFHGAAGYFQPGTLVYSAGQDGHPENYGSARFTAPSNGVYRVETRVQSLYEDSTSGDTDYHVVVNGSEAYGTFVAANSSAGYTNSGLTLAAGDVVDFLVGRGADGTLYDSQLKVQATLTLTTNAPPPPTSGGYDLSKDFSTNSNPGGAWSYGYKSEIGGAFTLFTFKKFSPDNNGLLIFDWAKNTSEPSAVFINPTTNTSIAAGGAGVYPPGSVWFLAGVEGHVDNYGAIRFTVPPGATGSYRLESFVRSYLDGSISRDADYHVVYNGTELYGIFMAPNSTAGYTNVFSLAAGDTIDFLVGRGADGVQSGSGLKIQATLTLTTNNLPPIPTYTLVTQTPGGGSISRSPNATSYLSNSVVTVTANASNGWTFLGWVGDSTTTSPTISLTMTNNKVLQAIFGTYLATAFASNGVVTVDPQLSLYPYGSSAQITAVPDPGSYFSQWGGSASGNANPLRLVMTNANTIVIPYFGVLSSGQFTLNLSASGSGQVSATPRLSTYSVGQSVTLVAVADTNQTFLGWSGDAGGTQNPLTITMTANKNITANFTRTARLSSSLGENQEFQLTLGGDLGGQYRIDASTNLTDWTPLTTVTNTLGTVRFTDPAAGDHKSRFYRAVRLSDQ
jgi:uncharacterized repeat protein (TIGR02543 family)